MNGDKFNYTYSAPTEEERIEIEAVRREYLNEEKKQDALSKMRALDKKVRLPAEICAYVLGVIATLLLGTGMSIATGALTGGIVIGTVIGIIGIVLLVFNYKIYKLILNFRKKKFRRQMLEITDGLLDEKTNH